MGIIKSGGLDSNILTGTVGSHTFRYTNRQLVVSQKAAEVTDRRSYEQIAHRSLMPNVSLTAKLLTSAAFRFAFEEERMNWMGNGGEFVVKETFLKRERVKQK